MSLYSLSGGFFNPDKKTFTNIDNFDSQCVDCYKNVIQLGYEMELCDNRRYTSTCPYLSTCQKECYKNNIKSQLFPGVLFQNINTKNTLMNCQNQCSEKT